MANRQLSRRRATGWVPLLFKLGLGLVLLILLAVLPVIPIQYAPVIPNPSYSLTWASLFGLFGRIPVGVSYRWEWYTTVTALLLVLVAIGLWLLAGRALTKARA